MLLNRKRQLIIAVLLILLGNLGACAKVPVANGLALSLDAREQVVARAKAGFAPLADGRPMERWLDTSGGERHAVQSLASARPTFKIGEGQSFVRFDGKDDFFTLKST